MNSATFTIGAETSNARTVAVQLGSSGTAGAMPRPVGAAYVVDMYLSSDIAGEVPLDAVNFAVVPTAGADGAMLVAPNDTANTYAWKMVSETDGDIDVVLTNAADENKTVYLNVVLPSGKLATSTAIAFVDNTP